MNQQDVHLIVQSFKPQFVFWNTATPTLKSDSRMGRLVKGIVPGAITGVMGTHVTAMPEVALGDAGIDLVIRGEPEETVRSICSSENLPAYQIKGVSWRSPGNGEIHHNPEREWIPAESIPSPAWQYLDLNPYRLPLKGRRFLIVAPVRGCPYGCSFCTAPLYYGRKLRKRPLDAVMKEISEGIEQFGIVDFFVWADTFTADEAYVRAFSKELLRRRFNIRWTCNSRVDTVNRQMLSEMKEAGLWMISFGLESGDDAILEKSGKKIHVAQSRRAVNLAHDLGIRTSGHFILGLPGETQHTMEKTLRLALELPLDVAQFYAAAPFPGTRLFREAEEKGWISAGGSCSQSAAVLNLPGLSPERVDAFRRYAHRRFYGRPAILRNLLALTRPLALASIFKNAGLFFERFQVMGQR